LVIANRVGYCHLQGIALIERARATWDGGDLSTAEADLRSAIDILGRLQAAFDLARARLLLAALLYQQQRPEAMAAWLEAMRAMITGGYEFVAEQERTLAFPLIAAYAESPHPDVKAMSTVLLAHLQQIPPPPLHIRGLGRFEVRQQARIIDDRAWSRRRAGELFRLLLLSPQHSLSREQVLESLWPDRDPTTTDDSLHQTTSALRRCLEPDLPSKFPSRYLKVEGGRISLVLPAGSWVDFEAFESLIQDQAWEQALVLYEGDLFPADRYADWAAGPRERLLLKFHQALLVVGRQHLQVGRFQEALEASHRILAVDPWNESAVLLGMRASIAMNQRAEALRLYRELECTLQKDLGIAPQDEVRILYESLL
jgi:DNA-binding SARP family transcriptional activator